MKRRVIQTRRRIETATRVPGTPRGGHARHRQERAARLRSSVPARDLLLPRKRNATCESRRVQVTARRPTVRQRIGSGQRNWHRLVPASSGAKAPLACEDRWLVGCARASYSVAEVGERRRGSKKRVSRWLRGAWTGTQLSRSPQGVTRECKGVDNQHRGGQAAELGKARAGRSRGRCGAKVFVRQKASQVVRRHVRSRGRVEGGLGGPHETRNARASREARGRRQRCQRLGPHASRREDNARHGDSSRGTSCDPPKRIALS